MSAHFQYDVHVNMARQCRRMQGVHESLGTRPGGKRVGGSLSNRRGGVVPVGRKREREGGGTWRSEEVASKERKKKQEEEKIPSEG